MSEPMETAPRSIQGVVFIDVPRSDFYYVRRSEFSRLSRWLAHFIDVFVPGSGVDFLKSIWLKGRPTADAAKVIIN